MSHPMVENSPNLVTLLESIRCESVQTLQENRLRLFFA
jgi:hypothetical protein